MLVIHLILQHRSPLGCFMTPLSSHCSVMAILLIIILLKIIYEWHLNPASWWQHPGVCSYWGSLCRQLFLSSCSLSLPWLQTEILHELREFKTWVGKKEQLLSETCRWLNLLQCSCSEWERVVSPIAISTNIQKQSKKWQNSSAYLHWRYRYPYMNICNVALEQMHQALLTATFPKRFPFHKY